MSVQRPSENRILLKTSEFSCFFEPQTGFLRQVVVNGCEVIRAIYGAVRDQNWDTVQPKIVVSPISQSDDHFCLEFQVECSSSAIEFRWNGTIEGNAGTLSFKFAGEAISTFKKNRIGLCLLHPIRECIGKRCRVRDISNTWLESEFPLFISPHQPFKNLSAISWVPVADLETTVTFAGDVFETEDQRNWTDASFKTYCTPLEKPFPATIEAGTKIIQSITLELVGNGQPPTLSSIPNQEIIVVWREGETALPSLGVCANGSGKPLTEVERAACQPFFDHLRVDVGSTIAGVKRWIRGRQMPNRLARASSPPSFSRARKTSGLSPALSIVRLSKAVSFFIAMSQQPPTIGLSSPHSYCLEP
jgi:hypothetical protein